MPRHHSRAGCASEVCMTIEEQVAEAIKGLPMRLRRVFVMAHVQHKPYAEIAETLGIPQERMERRLARALAVCRKRLPDLRWQDDGAPR